MSPVPSPILSPDPLSAREGVYTLAWISDTQHYSNRFPDIYHRMTEFLYANRERLNLKYVIHTGDIASWADREGDYSIAAHAMDALGDIPYGVLPGNHDATARDDRTTLHYENYIKYFGAAAIKPHALTADVYLDNIGHVDLLSAGGTDYAFVYMGWPVDEAGVAFINSMFKKYADRVGVLCVHDYFNNDLSYTEQGQMLFDSVVRQNDNLYMVLCGHRYNSRTVPIDVQNEDGSARTVLQCITNYQSAGQEGGSGYIRFIQVDEENECIRMINYSPLLDDYSFFDDPENRDDPYYFDPDGEQELISIPWIGQGGA